MVARLEHLANIVACEAVRIPRELELPGRKHCCIERAIDTNVLSLLVRRPAGLRAKIAIVGDDALCTSVIVACELRFGALKKGSVELSARVDALLDAIAVLPLDARIDRVYAEIRQRLESAGLRIGSNDYLIAAHALVEECTLVTQNVKEFRRVPTLAVESWLPRRPP